jgi:hypothetical protein
VGPDGKDLARCTDTETKLIFHSLVRANYVADVERNDYLNLRRPQLYADSIPVTTTESTCTIA